MNNSGGMSGSGSPMHDMNSPLGPNGPGGPMGSPMGGMGGPGGSGGPGGPNNMMVPCSKSSPMGMSGGPGGPGGPNGPDPTQPLPPSGLSGNGYNKNSPIMGGPGPVSSDPNYPQQFLNFQQQLYATNTRSQGGGGMSPGMGSMPHRSNTPPGFNPNWQSSGPLSK